MSKRWAALLIAVVPGLGHLYLGRHWRGLLAFLVFALAVNGMFFADLVDDPVLGVWVESLCRGAAVAVWLYSLLHVAYLCKQFERRPIAERKEYHFKRGLAHYLSSAFDAACSEFLAVLKLDPLDIDARFHLAMTYKALGHRRNARRAFRRCLTDDFAAKWKWEIETQLKTLKKG